MAGVRLHRGQGSADDFMEEVVLRVSGEQLGCIMHNPQQNWLDPACVALFLARRVARASVRESRLWPQWYRHKHLAPSGRSMCCRCQAPLLTPLPHQGGADRDEWARSLRYPSGPPRGHRARALADVHARSTEGDALGELLIVRARA